ncbi:peroxiredoxin [Amantichitinum ursilacus]|uniref:thioredoxin-dependent peroxiredoxin n=1 Tax=Amantichitinum ursilacus TaxID=857265 RepID=A0A0N1JSA5_9NEIS|nr:peroxiredoxin [Amantichitinum ursilacus]KPC52536.1 putative peroxiredoxin [Amantichitinum ursilacus]
MLKEGDLAPEFSLPAADMRPVSLSDYAAQNNIVVVYFFNGDHTPGGITEAVEFSERTDAFKRAGAVVLGISPDDCLAHEAFIDEHGLEFELLSDAESVVSKLYHVVRQWELNGVIKSGIERSTFVIDRRGLIRHAFYHVSPKGHAEEILTLVKQLG